jgi:hypothetical protein
MIFLEYHYSFLLQFTAIYMLQMEEEKRLNIVILFWEFCICYCLQVRLLNPDTQAQCIGTRIKPQWVLTAANCNPR